MTTPVRSQAEDSPPVKLDFAHSFTSYPYSGGGFSAIMPPLFGTQPVDENIVNVVCFHAAPCSRNVARGCLFCSFSRLC